MATLEKIRSKSVLLIAIIGVALIAFIIGDFLNSGRSIFGTGTTIAKVDGKKINVIEYQNRLQQQQALYQQQNRKIDNAQLEQQVIDAMITEALFNEEAERLGLTVTDAELSDIMLGRGAQILSSRVSQETNGQIQSINDLYNMIQRPNEYGLTPEYQRQFQAFWQQLERETTEQIIQQKFMNLFTGSLVANELDAKAFYDENAAPTHVAYVKKQFENVDSIKVSDDEINSEWAKTKNAYKIDGELRSVNYITVAIVPSADDLMKGQQRVEEALMALRSADNASAISSMPEFVVDNRHSTVASIRDRQLKNFIDTASVGQTEIISKGANMYTIVKLIDRKSQIDSVNVDFMAVQGRAQFDSIYNALRAGGNFSELAKSEGVVQSTDSTWVSLQSGNNPTLTTLLSEQPVGVYFTPDTAATTQGGSIYRINTRRAAVPVVDYAYITYTVDPSETTVNKLEADLAAFIAENADAESFAANAIQAGYQVFPANINASTPSLNNVEDSRAPIVWALDAKKGQVSNIFGNEQTGRFIAIAVNDVYNDFIPARDPRVKSYLEMKVRSDKAGEQTLAKYAGKGKSLADYSSVMKSPVDTINVNFGQAMVASFGLNESELQAQVANAKPNTLVGPVKANNAVVVFEVTGTDAPARPYVFEEAAQTFNSNRGAYRLSSMLQQILLGDKEIENNLAKFYRHE